MLELGLVLPGQFGPCVGEVTPSVETCDLLDNDCDSGVDEDYPTLNTPCSAGVGVCFRPGILVCTAAGDSVECNATPGAPSPEVCDGFDNNCDGAVDEDSTSCEPFVCSSGACLTSCSSDSQCAPGFVCDPTQGDVCVSDVSDATGAFAISPSIIYSCHVLGLVNVNIININSFSFTQVGSSLTAIGLPGTSLGSSITHSGTIPGSGFLVQAIIPGTFEETRTLNGNFVDNNTWQGTYSLTFTGDDPGGDCTDQVFNIVGLRQ